MANITSKNLQEEFKKQECAITSDKIYVKSLSWVSKDKTIFYCELP